MSLVSAVATCGICGKLGSGFLSEKITARYTFCVLLLMQIVAMALFLLGTPDRAALWAALLIYGVGFGGIGAMLSLIVIDTCKYTSPLRDSPLKSLTRSCCLSWDGAFRQNPRRDPAGCGLPVYYRADSGRVRVRHDRELSHPLRDNDTDLRAEHGAAREWEAGGEKNSVRF